MHRTNRACRQKFTCAVIMKRADSQQPIGTRYAGELVMLKKFCCGFDFSLLREALVQNDLYYSETFFKLYKI